MTEKKKKNPEVVIREIKRQTRRKFTSEEKIRIVLEGDPSHYFGHAKSRDSELILLPDLLP